MAKKPKAQPSKVAAEDALRLRCALLELESIRVSASKAVADAADAAEAIRVDIWARYKLCADDAIDLKTYDIKKAG